jgi:hypothetical protein
VQFRWIDSPICLLEFLVGQGPRTFNLPTKSWQVSYNCCFVIQTLGHWFSLLRTSFIAVLPGGLINFGRSSSFYMKHFVLPDSVNEHDLIHCCDKPKYLLSVVLILPKKFPN